MNNTFFNSGVSHIIAALFLVIGLADGQLSKPGYGDRILFQGLTGVTVGGTQQTWNLKNFGTIVQQSAPIYVSLPLSNRILFTVANAGAIAKYDTAKIQGIADTRFSLSYVLPGDKLWILAGASYPTGKTQLSLSELQITTLISQAAFGYKVPVFGQGINANGGLTYASSITRRFVVGIGANYIYKGKYQPVLVLSNTFDYDPGDEISVNIGADYITRSKTYRYSVDLNATYFMKDQLNNETIFHSGPRVIGFFVLTGKSETMTHTIQLRGRVRANNTYYESGVANTYPSAMQFEGQYSLQTPLSSWLIATLTGEGKFYTEDQIPISGQVIKTGKAMVYGGGTDLLMSFSETITPMLTIRYFMGDLSFDPDLNSTIEKYTVTGLETSLTVKVSF